MLAYIPARLTALFLLAAGALMRLPWQEAWKHVPAEAKTMDSPNAGWSMSACAWLLDGGMGGPAVYFGEAKMKPELGPAGRGWSIEKIKKLFRLMAFAAFLGLFVLQAMKVVPPSQAVAIPHEKAARSAPAGPFFVCREG
jgi:adenosylcobinamide-phosphate synthase